MGIHPKDDGKVPASVKTEATSSKAPTRTLKRKRGKRTVDPHALAPSGGVGILFGPRQPSVVDVVDVRDLMIDAGAPTGCVALVPSEHESPEQVPPGFFCVHSQYISKCHLRFPLPSLLLDLLDHYGIALPQLCPSAIRVILGLITRAKEEGIDLQFSHMMDLFTIKESPLTKGAHGTYYLSSRPRLGIFCFSASDEDWRKRFFFVKADPRTVPDGRVMCTSWSRIADIVDPPKISSKLARALVGRLKQEKNNWGAYKASRINRARFPEKYEAQFPEPVSVDSLEVSEDDEPINISTGASTS